MKLYQDSGNLSASAKRVRVVCYEAGAPLEIVGMDLMKGEWTKPEYLAKNPMGKVPTLEDDGYVLWESPAILFHVANKFADRGLLPTDTRGKTEMMRWMFWNASHLEVAVSTVAFEKAIKPMLGQTSDPTRVEAGTKDWERFAPILDAQLAGKQWVLGPSFSIVDIALGTTVEMAAGACGFDLKKHPHVHGWFQRVTSRDAWKRAGAK